MWQDLDGRRRGPQRCAARCSPADSRTVAAYLSALERLFIVENLTPWPVDLRSRAHLASTPIRLRDKVDFDKTGEPARLLVITAGGYAYERPDGVTVAPITTLGP